MFGSKLFKVVHGDWHHVGWGKVNLTYPGVVVLAPRGMLMDWKAATGEGEFEPGNGTAIGLTTQDIHKDYGVQLLDSIIENPDHPIKNGGRVSLRVPDNGAELEYEGLGAAAVGNLVATTGTGALSAVTARMSPLSVLNGAWRLAQTGEQVLAYLLAANLTPEIVGNLRIKIRWVNAGLQPAP